ncbi:MAG: hypothetical protein C7B43_21635 [Sulfobacillus benefaciens]|uniref:Uncharacterized protein n=1 Tax=Sulfobacillus benefaciens TaxID=453960 RepID=A0A2T2WF70_9FIRM|nr:MAG: hypothetical protein C7B43_21635 [Sulfobacillus benefaciens]
MLAKKHWGIIGLFSLVLSFMGSTPALACTYADHHIGMATTTISTQGAQAVVYNYAPYVCSQGGVSAWSMIANSNNYDEFAQVGWLRGTYWGSGCDVYFFYEYGQSNAVYNPAIISVDSAATNYGTSNKFTVYTNGNNVTQFLINNVNKASVSLNWSANHAEWLGETHSPSDQVVGASEQPVYFKSVQHLYNGTWYNDMANLNKWNTTQYGAGYWPQSNYFYIYDVRYTTGETYCA